MKIKPIGERVLVKIEKKEEKSPSGLILPSIEKNKGPVVAQVVAVGTGEDVKIIETGNKIIFPENSGYTIKDGDDTFVMLELKEILGIVE